MATCAQHHTEVRLYDVPTLENATGSLGMLLLPFNLSFATYGKVS